MAKIPRYVAHWGNPSRTVGSSTTLNAVMNDGSDSTGIAALKPVCLRQRVASSSLCFQRRFFTEKRKRESPLLRLHHTTARLGKKNLHQRFFHNATSLQHRASRTLMGRLRKHPSRPSKYNLLSLSLEGCRARKLSQMCSWWFIVSGGWCIICGSTPCAIFLVPLRLVQPASGTAVSYSLGKSLSRLVRCTKSTAT